MLEGIHFEEEESEPCPIGVGLKNDWEISDFFNEPFPQNDAIFDQTFQERAFTYPDSGPTKLPDFSLLLAKPFSVKFYYTPEFAESFENDNAKIRQTLGTILDITNEGFHNSKLPIVMTLNCYERATISDRDAGDITAFEKMKGTEKDLRQSADMAILLTKDLYSKQLKRNICGMANTLVAVVELNCALGHKSVGHEIGHIFGAPGDHLNGHIFLKRKSNKLFRTIMAYYDPNEPTDRANKYSSPTNFEVIDLLDDGRRVKPNGTISPYDIDGYNVKPSTADIIVRNFERIAAKGDESEACIMRPKERKSEIHWISPTYLMMGPTHFANINIKRTLAWRRRHFCKNFPKHCEPGHPVLHGRHGELNNVGKDVRKSIGWF